MKQKYIAPTAITTAVEARGMFLDNLSFQVGDDPHGGWSDAKERDQQKFDPTDAWSQGLW